MDTRQTILASVAILVVIVIGAWWYLGFTLDFMRFFAAQPIATCVPRPSCMNDSPPCEPDLAPGAVLCPPSGVIVECLPAQQTVKVGDAAHLSAQGGNGAYEWYSPEGGRVGGIIIGADGPITNTYSVMYNKAGTKKVTVESPRGDGSANVDSVACTVIVEPSLPQ